MANPIDDFRELFFTIADKSIDGDYVSIQNIWLVFSHVTWLTWLMWLMWLMRPSSCLYSMSFVVAIISLKLVKSKFLMGVCKIVTRHCIITTKCWSKPNFYRDLESSMKLSLWNSGTIVIRFSIHMILVSLSIFINEHKFFNVQTVLAPIRIFFA